MKDFIKFIVKLILVFALATATFNLLFFVLWKWDKGPMAYNNSYQKALLLQYQALSDEDREPEVIVFGSSYVPFGIDVATLSEETGRDAQILGIEAGIGIPILVDILYETAKPGDTIVYMLGKSNGYHGDPITLSAAFESDKDVLNWYWSSQGTLSEAAKIKLTWRKLYSICAGGTVEYVRYSLSHKEQVYSLDSFDEKGNMTGERVGTLVDVDYPDTLTWEELEENIETLDMLNEFSEWCNENDITFVICYAMSVDGTITNTDEEVNEYHKQVSDYMTADVLLTPQDYYLPASNFYNHVAHLNTEGAINYSTILGQALKEYLDGDKEKVVTEE